MAGCPVRLYGPVNRPSPLSSPTPNGGSCSGATKPTVGPASTSRPGQARVDRRDQLIPAGQRRGVLLLGDRRAELQQRPGALGVPAGVPPAVHLMGLAGHDHGQHVLPFGQVIEPGRGDLAQVPAGRGERAERPGDGRVHLRRHRRIGQLAGQHADRERGRRPAPPRRRAQAGRAQRRRGQPGRRAGRRCRPRSRSACRRGRSSARAGRRRPAGSGRSSA